LAAFHTKDPFKIITAVLNRIWKEKKPEKSHFQFIPTINKASMATAAQGCQIFLGKKTKRGEIY
jgi:hypothetical protein